MHPSTTSTRSSTTSIATPPSITSTAIPPSITSTAISPSITSTAIPPSTTSTTTPPSRPKTSARITPAYIRYVLDTGRITDINAPDDTGWSLLARAVGLRCVSSVQLLLARGADINVTTPQGQTPVHVACVNKKYLPDMALRCLDLLLAHKHVDVNARDIGGDTPLHYAIVTKWSQVIARLCAHPRIDFDVENMSGQTPLCLACIKGNWFEADIVYAAGARVHMNRPWCQLMYEYVSNTHPPMRRIVRLCQYGYDINFTHSQGCTLLHYIAEYPVNPYTQELCQLLLKLGARTCVLNADGVSVFKTACYRNNHVLVELLLQTNIDQADIDTSLEYLRNINGPMVRLLVARGFELTEKHVHDLFSKFNSDALECIFDMYDNGLISLDLTKRFGTHKHSYVEALTYNPQILRRILSYDVCHVDALTPYNYTALDSAGADGTEVLLDFGADVDASLKNVALEDALIYQDYDRVRLLLLAGAKLQYTEPLTDSFGVAPQWSQLEVDILDMMQSLPRFDVPSLLDVCCKYIRKNRYLIPATVCQQNTILPQELLDLLTEPVRRHITQQWRNGAEAALARFNGYGT